MMTDEEFFDAVETALDKEGSELKEQVKIYLKKFKLSDSAIYTYGIYDMSVAIK